MGQSGEHTETSKQTPDRGTIIVDATVLFGLTSEIPQNHEDRLAARRYLEILPFLAKHGYHIIIPEMVSAEAAGIMASGTALERFYITNKDDPKQRTTSVMKPLLTDIAHGNIANMEIRQNSGFKPADSFCDELRSSVKVFNDNISQKGEKRDSEKKAYAAAHRAIETARKNMQPDVDYGDEAILSILSGYNKDSTAGPVFVFTDDKKLRERVTGTFPHVKTVVTTELIHSVHRNKNIAAAVGIPHDMEFLELENRRRLNTKYIMGNDRSAKLHSSYSYVGQEPDMDMSGLEEELEGQKASAPPPPDEAGSARVAKFNKKFAKFHRTGGGAGAGANR